MSPSSPIRPIGPISPIDQDEQRTFVGRQAELNRFREVLEDPQGQAVVIVGQAGMGKTWLIDRMAHLATQHQHPDLKCGCVRYEVTPTDSPDSTMALMMDNAFEAAQTSEGSFDMSDRRKTQWAALFKTFVPKGSDILELLASLRRDPQKHTREQFLDRLRLIAKQMDSNGRAIFVIDPEKYMCQGCADTWRLVTRELPEKVKFLFAQRPEDELVNSNGFMALDNVIRLPDAPLGVLATEEVEDLVRLRANGIGQSGKNLLDAMARYEGHPYAVQAAMEIVKKTKRIEDLPQDPTPEKIAAAQWKQVCRTGENAIRLFEACAILEVAVPQDVVQTVSGLDTVAMKRLLSDPYLSGLLRDEGQGRRIYHAILADHVRSQIDQDQQKTFHTRAILLYRTRLKEAREQHKAPDALAAVRLPEHVLAIEGPETFIGTFIKESMVPLRTLGLLDAVMSLSGRCLKLVKKDTKEEATILGNQALILWTRGDIDEAMVLIKDQERICRQLGDLDGLQMSLLNQSVILKMQGDLDGAMALLKEQERVCRHSGNLAGLSANLGNQALILQDRGNLDGAMTLHKEEEGICRQLGDLDGLQTTLGNQGLILKTRGDFDGAMALYKEKERICRQLGNLDSLQRSLGNQAVILTYRGDLDGAMALHKEQERICRRLDNPEGLHTALGGQALILRARGDLDGAMNMFREVERICRQLGNLDGLQRTLGNQALILHDCTDFKGAMALLKEQEEICRRLGKPDSLASSLGNQGVILRAGGDSDGAMNLFKEQERICRQLGSPDDLQRALYNQALTLQDHGDLDGAMTLHKEREEICQQLEDYEGLLGSLCSQASVLQTRGELDEAIAPLRRLEGICRRLDKPDGLAISLFNQALVLGQMGRMPEALPLAEKAQELASQHGYTTLLKEIEPFLDELRRALGEAPGKT
ncbi:MAG: AAA family ATPase [Phycisphaerales bacterium]